MASLFDHCYFDRNGLRLRIIGPFEDGGLVTFLIRTTFIDGKWVKPPLYATEVADEAVMDLLEGFAKLRVASRTLPAVDPTLLVEPISPYHWFTNDSVSIDTRTLLENLCSDAGVDIESEWGLGGSRLLGSAHQNSDIDLIFQTSGEKLRSQFLSALDNFSVATPEKHSGRARRFLQIYCGSNPNPQARNIFGGLWKGLRVDMFSTFPEELMSAATIENLTQPEEEKRQWVFKVISSDGRIHYPIHLVGADLGNLNCQIPIFSFDTAMHYVLDGDIVTGNQVSFFRDRSGARIGHFIAASSVR